MGNFFAQSGHTASDKNVIFERLLERGHRQVVPLTETLKVLKGVDFIKTLPQIS